MCQKREDHPLSARDASSASTNCSQLLLSAREDSCIWGETGEGGPVVPPLPWEFVQEGDPSKGEKLGDDCTCILVEMQTGPAPAECAELLD